jgi:hypothetical protein
MDLLHHLVAHDLAAERSHDLERSAEHDRRARARAALGPTLPTRRRRRLSLARAWGWALPPVAH